jgi:hypothetical protein
MNNWIKISDEEFDIEMSIAKLKKGELQIKYAKDISKLRNIIKEVRECINRYAIENEDYSKIYNDEEKELLGILEKEVK